ncbi:CSN3 COP9 constitutive [Piedraia hortae CBS 480.64]|uniref:CSN3 COP9 constitutive n=1 Tax=Piedraia hortae CBS 480.64 TaxID=1314780 RepID=A0A6A7BXN3_9PEZI|nr:CSN3 COP9 constitutive [Piedraia hortae CBS 480.64]
MATPKPSKQSILKPPLASMATNNPDQYNKRMLDYVHTLKLKSQASWMESVDGKNVLETLNPAVQSIPFLIALSDQLFGKSKVVNWTDFLLHKALQLLASFDPVQVRYASSEWMELLVQTCVELSKHDPVDLRPISAAWLRLDPTGGTLTVFHLSFLRICLESRVPSQALPLLDKDIYAIAAKRPPHPFDEPVCENFELSNNFITIGSFSTALTTAVVLEYHLLGASVYIGARNWKRARLFLEYVLLTPSINGTPSFLQVEAYRKWILVGLIDQGKRYKTSLTHNQAVFSALVNASLPYIALAEAFERRDFKKFHAEMDIGKQIWTEDSNFRFVEEVHKALVRWRVMDLEKTFDTLPISAVATHLEYTAEDALHIASEMVKLGDMDMSVTPAATAGEAIVRFHDVPVSPATMTWQNSRLQAQQERLQVLAAQLADANHRLQLTQEYVVCKKKSKLVRKEDIDGSTRGVPPTNEDDEEDIMEL